MADQPFEVLGESEYLTLVRRNGWSYVQRRNEVQVVGIVAVTPNDCLLLVEQYRPPVECRVIALPAGLVGDALESSESLQTAAQRELLEETGYEAQAWSELATVTSSAGLTNETVTLFRASHLTRQSAGGGVGNEQISVHAIPRHSVAGWLQEQSAAGKQIDSRVYAAMYWTECK